MSRKTPMERAREYDELAMDKDDVLYILNALIKRWKKNRWANAKYILAAEAIRVGILSTPNRLFKKIWGDVERGLRRIQALNEARRARGENPKMSVILDLLIAEIERGEFGDPSEVDPDAAGD